MLVLNEEDQRNAFTMSEAMEAVSIALATQTSGNAVTPMRTQITVPGLGSTLVSLAPLCRPFADIVETATNSYGPVFEAADLSPGVHVNAIGSYRPDMQEIPSEDKLLGILGEIVIDGKPGCENTSEITIFKSVGIAAMDVVLGKFLYDRARKIGVGQQVSLM